jgi:DNA-binding transcriptional regulator WhiA
MRKGSHHSESTKQLISLKLKQKYAQGWAPRLGKRHSDETRKKISMSRKGRFVGENNPFYGKHHTEETRRRISEKKRGQYLVKPRLDVTPDLAYILGVLKGDGCVYKHRRGADVKLVTKDYTFARSFAEALTRIGLNPRIYLESNNQSLGRGVYFRVEASSKAFYTWYKSMSLKDIESMLTSQELIASFIRGFYESEGNYYKPEHCIHIYNTDRELIEMLQRLLQKLGLNFNIYVKKHNGRSNKPLYVLHKKHGEEVRKFFEIVKPCIKHP